MKNAFLLFFLVIVISALIGCQTTQMSEMPPGPGAPGRAMSAPTNDPEKAAIEKVFAEMTETWNKRDAKGFTSFWTLGSKVITYGGDIHQIKDPFSPKRIAEISERMGKVGKVKYLPTKIKIRGNEADVVMDYTCSLCNRGRTGHLLIRFKLIKENGQWKVKEQDAS